MIGRQSLLFSMEMVGESMLIAILLVDYGKVVDETLDVVIDRTVAGGGRMGRIERKLTDRSSLVIE